MADYKVTEADLVGELKGYPIEIVEKMLELQEIQGNKFDISVFQKSNKWGLSHGGFSWGDCGITGSRESDIKFWSSIIHYHNWGTFFKRFPKTYKDPEVYKEEEKPERDDTPDIDFMSKTNAPYEEKKVEVELDDNESENEENNPFAQLEFNRKPLDEPPFIGELILVSDSDHFSGITRVFIGKDDNLPAPILTITKESYQKLLANGSSNNIRLCPYKNYRKIAPQSEVELTLEDISKGKGVGIPAHLIKIKL